jgi:hypothetical protein
MGGMGWEQTRALQLCMKQHSDYYGDLLGDEEELGASPEGAEEDPQGDPDAGKAGVCMQRALVHI